MVRRPTCCVPQEDRPCVRFAQASAIADGREQYIGFPLSACFGSREMDARAVTGFGPFSIPASKRLP